MGLLDEWGQFGFGSLSGVFIPDGREVMFSPCYMTSGIFPSDLEFGSTEFQKPKQLIFAKCSWTLCTKTPPEN